VGPPKQANIVEDLIIALRDHRVLEAISAAVVQPLLESINELKRDNEKKTHGIVKLQNELTSASRHIEALEQYTRRNNLLIAGLPLESFADAASTLTCTDEPMPSSLTKHAVLQLFSDTNVSIKHLEADACNGQGMEPVAGPRRA